MRMLVIIPVGLIAACFGACQEGEERRRRVEERRVYRAVPQRQVKKSIVVARPRVRGSSQIKVKL